ncbi:MAG: SUMF1/EgtB/PvdO family nonheme iron enzyme [Chitinophagales bacterium]
MTSFFKNQTWISSLNVLLLLFCAAGLSANNIQIGAPTLTGENRTEGYVFVTFDLSWENSWRGTEANNWDAAWVFVKFRIGGGEWQHAKLHNTGHLPGTGTPATISAGLINEDIPFEPSGNPAVGAFIYRSGDGFGTFNTTANKLRWNYAAHGITNATSLEVNVFAIEMVYVPEGEFNVGGGGGYNAFTSTTINTANATTAPSGTGSLGGQAGGYPTGVNPPVSPNWPNGYDAFYCMKYEISQQQYVDFLNSLTPSQSINLVNGDIYYGNSYYNNYTYYRYGILGDGQGSFTTSLPYLACNWIYQNRGAAYVDWAGLRPMSELEFEKACRGNQLPVQNENAWGNSSYQNASYTLSFVDQENEGIASNYSTTSGNVNIGQGVFGPMRVGIFAANGSNTGRITSGASYWGIMELSGNLYDQCLLITENNSSQYSGYHGDGILTINGSSTEFTSLGLIARGGAVGQSSQVSGRDSYIYFYEFLGYRGVRG